MSLFGPGQTPLVTQVINWEGILPATGDYYLQVKPAPGVSQSNYQLTVSLTDPTRPSPSPTPTPTLSPEPSPPPVQVEVEQVRFAEGESAERISDTASPSRVRRYLVNAQEGQVLTAQVIDGLVTNIRSPDGELIENASQVLSWESQLTTGGDYQIDVIAPEETDFSLNVEVRDLE